MVYRGTYAEIVIDSESCCFKVPFLGHGLLGVVILGLYGQRAGGVRRTADFHKLAEFLEKGRSFRCCILVLRALLWCLVGENTLPSLGYET
jgi:hypothetical protein